MKKYCMIHRRWILILRYLIILRWFHFSSRNSIFDFYKLFIDNMGCIIHCFKCIIGWFEYYKSKSTISTSSSIIHYFYWFYFTILWKIGIQISWIIILLRYKLRVVSCDIPPTKSFLEWRLSEESIELVSAIEWEELSWIVDCTNLLMSCKSSTPQCDINTYIWVEQWSYSSVKHSTILSYHGISYITCTTFYYQSNHFHLIDHFTCTTDFFDIITKWKEGMKSIYFRNNSSHYSESYYLQWRKEEHI